ncbi:DEAD/DEAH box helicase [Oceanidesulfovibrio indonesiensis]|uniref:Type I restriction enzyme endonuclease subunit n=1 Tax=Oceanidesulfovibrio indonesiensis TaxID=54767 RepID=A0A7M3MAA0_9BACT|nr:type I restriction endonuclease subunit R [Oceanidesulfovibrio indonesiensis]TVM14538.1 DEAD/DEAH box helicase [Oceanidesulfovibrio indonesiensis]
MVTTINESSIEELVLELLDDLGYTIAHGPDVAPDGPQPERLSYGDVILLERLKTSLARINPHLSPDVLGEVIRKIQQQETPSLEDENHRLHLFMVDGVDVEVTREDGSIGGDKAWLVDFDNLDNNDWLALNQFTVIEGINNRRPDIVVFLNGLPVAVLELKNPGSEDATLESAYNQLQTYKAQVPTLFRSNIVLGTSDGILARLGSLTAGEERFMPWRTVDGHEILHKGMPELPTLLEGVFDKRRFLDYLRGFVVFESDGAKLIKKIAGYHQFHAVQHAVGCTVQASSPEGDRRVGVIWHTQGSGKSLLMVFYAGRIILHPAMANPTIVVITDRNDLDDQLYGTFCGCSDLLRQMPVKAESREHLKELLSVASGGIVFTTIQKFSPEKGEEYPLLTDRRNVVVIADEAHRSQYGFRAKVSRESGEISYGFAKHMRDALPGASFIGFTGTPIEATDVNTPAVFGNYIDIYDIQRAVEDEATVPIFYESRLAKIELDENEKPSLDEVDELAGYDDESTAERRKAKWSRVEALVGAEKRLKLIAKDIVEHFESRVAAMQGKAMIVCMSRRICVALYDELVALRPEWHHQDDDKGAVKVVMTGSASDPLEWQKHSGSKARRDLLAKRAKQPDDALKLVIVRDMWLTGFDAPCLHTMYVDKPMQGHGLMQAIARVNRVFKDKPGGLIVDYIGLAQRLKSALAQYSEGDRKQAGIDEREAVALMREKYEVVRDMYHGFDYSKAITGTNRERLYTIALAMDWIQEMHRKAAEREDREEDKKKAWRRYSDAVLALSKAYALAAQSDEAKRIRDEVGFFQTVKAALTKSAASNNGDKKKDVDLAVQQIISRAVISTEIVDILEAAGIDTPDISILSDEFLAELKGMEQKNFALEALKKLLNGQIRSQANTNVVKKRAFSDRLQDAINRYHTNAITTAQVLEELIGLAKDLRAARQRGEEDGLSQEEIAFYDALAENESAVQIMGDVQLKVIAHELLMRIKANVGVDWTHSENARARIRVMVKKILRKYGYPPDMQDEAVRTVLEQAEALSAQWSEVA